MEESENKKRKLDLNWEELLPGRDEEPPPDLVVTTTVAATNRKQSPQPMGGGQDDQSQRDELSRMKDSELEDAIIRQRRTLESTGPKLFDKGAKLVARIKSLEDEKERRKHQRLEKDDDGCGKLMQSKNPFTSTSDGLRQEVPSCFPASQSVFGTHFCKKLEDNYSRTVNAFEKDLSCLGRCDRSKMRHNGQLPREQQKSALSSRKSPFRCPTDVSVDVDKDISSNGNQSGEHCYTRSSRHVDESLSGSFLEKREASQILPLKNLRPKNRQTVVLVDEEEPERIKSIELADEVDESMKESKIYYPSSDDPEAVEISFSDMDYLAPEAYLSSTIMNFYIRYLQQPLSSTERTRCDYHFFNTYFYKKLKGAVSKKNDKEGSFVKFRRWWKGVSIFRKAYILLPIHENLHWSLIIICFPDKEDESGPIILHLDSLGLHCSKPIFDLVKSFLIEEWNYLNQEEAPSDLPISDRIWKHLPRRIDHKTIAVPQQRNDYDCGLFVLFFMERFIDEAPQRLRKNDLAMFGKQWFHPEEASNLRRKIRKLLMEKFHSAKNENRVSEPKPLSTVGPQREMVDHPIDC